MAPLNRSRLVELTAPECLLHLRHRQYGVGRVALGGDRPLILPVNYLLDGSTVVVRTGSDAILAAAEAGAWAAFEIDDLDDHGDASVELWSVLVRGRISRVVDQQEATYLRLARLEPAAGGFRPSFVRIAIEEMTGRARR